MNTSIVICNIRTGLKTFQHGLRNIRAFAMSAVAVSATVGLAFVPDRAEADSVLDWNDIMVTTFLSQSPPVNPLAAARLAAITHLAVFEAVNAVDTVYYPYLGTVSAQPGASAEAAAVAAAYTVLSYYFPGDATNLDSERANSLGGIPDGQAKNDGIAVGEAAAVDMITLRANDGAGPPQFHLPSSSVPGEWQLTAGCPPLGGVALHWGEVTPFGIDSGDQFRAPPPPNLRSSRYSKDYNEVKSVGGADSKERPADRADVANFYDVALAVDTWNPAARQVAAERATSLTTNARAFALLNMALSDGLVAVFDSKYHHRFWRPVTGIAEGDVDHNAKTEATLSFEPFISTPCHPSYPSAHASAAYAAVAVLERIYGKGKKSSHPILLTTPTLPDLELQYSTFEQIARDIDDARVYGGIHFRFDQTSGMHQGTQVGRFVLEHNLPEMNGYE